jgi:hypothetical protein
MYAAEATAAPSPDRVARYPCGPVQRDGSVAMRLPAGEVTVAAREMLPYVPLTPAARSTSSICRRSRSREGRSTSSRTASSAASGRLNRFPYHIVYRVHADRTQFIAVNPQSGCWRQFADGVMRTNARCKHRG